jgi:hypothetical protein
MSDANPREKEWVIGLRPLIEQALARHDQSVSIRLGCLRAVSEEKRNRSNRGGKAEFA